MDFKRRLIDSIGRTGLPDGAIADRLIAVGFDANHDKVFRWRKGKSLPSIDEIPLVAQGLDVDPVWLATGRYDAGTLSPDETTLLTVVRSLHLPLNEAIRRLATESMARKSTKRKLSPGQPGELQPELDEGGAKPARRGSA